jgi:hypothetical protein
MTETAVVARPAGEPAPDLTDYRVVHRAMAVDLARLTRAAAELVERPLRLGRRGRDDAARDGGTGRGE